MSSPEFLFALRLSGRPDDEMLEELAATILRFVGSAEETGDVVAGLRAGMIAGGNDGGSECDVRFRAHGGELEIVVSRGDRRVWRTSRALP